MMKKPYKKPEILFEDFSLSTRIASDCEVFPGDPALEYPGLGGGVFAEGLCVWNVDEIGGITNGPAGTDSYNDICYHNVSETNSIFTS